MDTTKKTFTEIVTLVKSWLPWKSEPANVSKDFWMPDHSCMVCYDCDSQFTVFNRRHHCRRCGLVFCAKCTANSIPAPCDDIGSPCEDREKIRVCNYCFKQWERGLETPDNGEQVPNLELSTSPSATSFVSVKSGCTTVGSSYTNSSMPYVVGHHQRGQKSPYFSCPSAMGTPHARESVPRTNEDLAVDRGNPSNPFMLNRSEDEDVYSMYRSDSETKYYPPDNEFYCQVEFDEMSIDDGSPQSHNDGENTDTKGNSPTSHGFDSRGLEEIPQLIKDEHDVGDECEDHDVGDECEASSSLYAADNVDVEPVDFENNGLLWLPPEPENEEDEKEAALLDDDDDDDVDAAGEWGRLRSSCSFGSREYQNKEKSTEEQKKAMKNVVDGHFRALVAQLLLVENLPLGDEHKEGWLEIITSLSWEAATLLKPDMSKGGGMDPGGYVKVKCIASGRRSESMVVKGVVCKKNVAHRRMISKIEKPRLLILGGALEYQRVSNQLSSFDTLLQQEMDHLKMAVAKIDAQHPNLLLVERSVSRFAQEYLLGKEISLVLNIKRPLLDRIARSTGAQIVPSIDHLSSQKLGYCDRFYVERYFEDLGTARQEGRKLVKTLMYFEGCPKPLGFTILLRGANGDELKKVKHVVQYGVFAAYHLAVETSFLADEGASLPELPLLGSTITVPLLEKPSPIERSISTVIDVPANEKSQEPQLATRSNSLPCSELVSSMFNVPTKNVEQMAPHSLPRPPSVQSGLSTLSSKDSLGVSSSALCKKVDIFEEKNEMESRESLMAKNSGATNGLATSRNVVNGVGPIEGTISDQKDHKAADANQIGGAEELPLQKVVISLREEPRLLEEAFPPSPSDNQSILVSLSSRCVWKGTVCERSHLFRIKYYGSFDKPLGRFLRDHLFDQSYRCHSCDMPSEAHVHCYTHRQGTLTISVKKLPDVFLPGERDGKMWMWHRCLRCPRTDGFPPATRRIVMSDAAWGLSFGKFLELSFSNHAAASRVASCGHSLHRDCLRFYGFGNMVACFRYASIDVLSVFLPPAELDFDFDNQAWIQKESTEVADRAELLFSGVLNTLSRITEKKFSKESLPNATKVPDPKHQIIELEGILQKEKSEFEESLQKALKKEARKGQHLIDILEINRLRRQLLFQAYMWDHRLTYAASLDSNGVQDGSKRDVLDDDEKPSADGNEVKKMNVEAEPGKVSDSVIVDRRLYGSPEYDGSTNQSESLPHESAISEDSNHENENRGNLSVTRSMYDKSENLEKCSSFRRVLSEGQFPVLADLSDTLDAAWTGETNQATKIPKNNSYSLSDSAVQELNAAISDRDGPEMEDHSFGLSPSPSLSVKGLENSEDSISWLRVPFLSFYRSLNKNSLANAQRLYTFSVYHPVYLSSIQELELRGGARLLLPVGVNDTVIPVYDDEPTSVICYALTSPEYHLQVNDDVERPKDSGDLLSSLPLFDSANSQLLHSVDDSTLDSQRSLGPSDDSILSMSGTRSALNLDPFSYTKALHPKVSFEDDGPLGKVKYSVTCYHAKRFVALRKICCPSELDFIRSLSRCKKWGAQGGKSNVFFAKSLDDRFIIKQVTKTELESFLKFASEYFKYLSESIGTGSPTCLAKILGIYQVTTKNSKGGKESRIDVLVMENLLYRRTITRLYDLKGSSRSRYNPDANGNNKVLLDQNLIEAMPTNPIFVSNKAKRLLERAVWNDTSFLASIDVMDYSLLVGVDEEKHQLVLGIIDFMRQYTWDKHLETWVKASGILGGPKNTSPTVISPKQYKKRFRKAMSTYFLMVPDQWSPSSSNPVKRNQSKPEDK